MFRPTQVQIDVEALKRNLSLLRSWSAPNSFFCPMIKDNAYGHDDIIVAHAAESLNPSALGVSMFEEGVRLREIGILSPILVFAPCSEGALDAILKHQLTPVIGSLADLDGVKAADRDLGIHLKFNTGMQRLGFDESEIPELKRRLGELTRLRIEGVCTHLTHGEEAHQTEGPTARQIEKFKKLTHGFPGHRHIHKSASLIALHMNSRAPEADLGARPGIAIYGLPFDRDPIAPELTPVLRWRTEVIRTHRVASGQGASYGWHWKAARDSVIGVVPVGYGDGYPRFLGGRAQMLVRGRRVPVVGRVCMDYTLLDLTDIVKEGSVQSGEEVVILGEQGPENISAGELADLAQTIAYEIATGIQRRVPRVVRPS